MIDSTSVTRRGSLDVATAKMVADGADESLVAEFSRHFHQLASGYTGLIPESSIDPLRVDHDLCAIEPQPADAELDSLIVMARLNGGLATSMGIGGAKSALRVKPGLTFLDVIARQVLAGSRQRHELILMNSPRTAEQSAAVLARYADHLAVTSLLQSRIPRLSGATLAPVECPDRPDLEWCPPGHGEFLRILRGGLAADLLRRGKRFMFVANADNLGATVDLRIAALMLRERIPFVGEVCRRALEDVKGGHVARSNRTGRLLVRDSNMVVAEEWASYVDNERHGYFNTNNLWFDLEAVVGLGDGPDHSLPLIVNHKTLDPRRDDSPQVIQLETGMGTSMSLFDGAVPVVVPRSRFIPVKDTAQLLVLRSDFYQLHTETYRVVPAREMRPQVSLDPRFYRVLDDFEHRFPAGPPSLAQCTSLTVVGDVVFADSVVVDGDLTVSTNSPMRVTGRCSSDQ